MYTYITDVKQIIHTNINTTYNTHMNSNHKMANLKLGNVKILENLKNQN